MITFSDILIFFYSIIALLCFVVAFVFIKYKAKLKVYVVKDKDNGERLGAFIDANFAKEFKNRAELRLGNTCYIDEE